MIAKTTTLRRRVAVAYTTLGFALSLLFSAAVVYIAEDYEAVLVREILRGQAEDYGLRLSRAPGAVLPKTHRLSGYLRDRRGHSDIPAEYANLPPGIHESGREGDGMHIGVFDTDAGRLVFVIDLRDIEELERHLAWFLVTMMLLGTALSGWLGWLLSRGTVAPVAALARAVDSLSTQPRPTALAASVGHDELGRLATAIDDYQARLVAANASEQAFFADASHELRTPIAVVQGAAEVLLDESDSDPARIERLQRLDRGVQELADLLEAMLGIARHAPLQPELVEAAVFLNEAVGSALQGRQRLGVEIDAEGGVRLPRREASLLLRGVLRRLCAGTSAGTVSLRLLGRKLEIALRGDAGAADAQGRRSDSGQMPVLTLRLAQRLGWELTRSDPSVIAFKLPEGYRRP